MEEVTATINGTKHIVLIDNYVIVIQRVTGSLHIISSALVIGVSRAPTM